MKKVNRRLPKKLKKLPQLSPADEIAIIERIEQHRGEISAALAQISPAVRDNPSWREFGLECGSDIPKHVQHDVLRLQKAEAALRNAINDMVEGKQQLVARVAVRYVKQGLSLNDLIQEGNIGLIKAAERFDRQLGRSFDYYAGYWIRQAISRAVANQGRTIRIPVHQAVIVDKVVKASRQLAKRTGRRPTPGEIAEEMGLPEHKVVKALDIARKTISLDTPIGAHSLADFIEDKNSPSPSDEIIHMTTKGPPDMVQQTLTPREKRVLRMRFGIGEGSDHTLDEVGQGLQITRERIRQIEAKALRKLRHPTRSQLLKSFIDTQ